LIFFDQDQNYIISFWTTSHLFHLSKKRNSNGVLLHRQTYRQIQTWDYFD